MGHFSNPHSLIISIDKIKSQKEGEESKEFIENVPFADIAMFILALIIPSFIKRHYKYVEGKHASPLLKGSNNW